MGKIIFEGLPPYALPIAQDAEASFVDETVDVTLTVLAPDIRPSLVQIQVAMPFAVARKLWNQLGPAAMEAEMKARRGST
jgi:hypothetical protein